MTPAAKGEAFCHSVGQTTEVPSTRIALVVASPPFRVGKSYDTDASFDEHSTLLEQVFVECHRVLQPGGRAVVNVANLGRRPYVRFGHMLTSLLLEMGFLRRGEVIWL